jgi:hypothetical protein
MGFFKRFFCGSSLFLPLGMAVWLTTQFAVVDVSAAVDIAGADGWVTIMYGVGKDPQGDSQAGAADTDIVGDANHGSFYVAFDDGGTASPADDYLYFRLRIDNPTGLADFRGVAVVGMDANLDGRIDIFMSIDARSNGNVIRLLDPGTGENISPNTTTTAPLPGGWLPSNGVYPFQVGTNFAVSAVSAATDPHWDGNNDIGGDGKVDAFVSWRVPMSDLAIVLAIPSPMDKNGNYGPRGPGGIPGFTADTLVRYVSFTQTQTGPINGDLNGVGRSYDKNSTFADLGTYTEPMSPANPVSASDFVRISQPISGDGVVNAAEDDALAVTGMATANGWIRLTVTDGTDTITVWTQAGADGTWTASGIDVSGLADGTLTFTATLVQGDGSDTAVTGSTGSTATAIHDTQAPAIAIATLAGTTAGKPTITGTCDLPDGSVVVVNVDPDNNPATTNLTYQVVISGGAWSLDLATVSPVSGTMPTAGLTAYAKITATATDAVGNSSTAVALNRPTVKALTTNNTLPTLTGTWINTAGDVLTVTVSDATYTLTPSGNLWSLNLATAGPSNGPLTPLTGADDPGNPYEVVATTKRGPASVSDTTSNELHITNAPIVSVSIDGGDEVVTPDPHPVITGTSENTIYVIVRIDPSNDGNLSDAVTYSVTPVGGVWTLDTETATPISGIFPEGGLSGDNGILATDSTGTVSDAQKLTVEIPTIAITGIISDADANDFGIISNTDGGEAWLNITEAGNVKISGTATDGFTVDLEICDPNENKVPVIGIEVIAGEWSVSGLRAYP